MAVITTINRGGKTEVSVGTSDPAGLATGDYQVAFNTATGRFFYRDNANNWRRYEEGVVLRATGVGATDTANLVAAAAASDKVLIDDRDAPLVLDQGGAVAVGDCFLQARHGMARINLMNNTRIEFGNSINVASHVSWADCSVSVDNDTITSATLAGAEAGDLILVVAENLISNVSPHFYPAVGASTRPHEISTISRIVGTNFYLGKRLVDTYTTTPKCALLKMSGAGGLATLSTRSGMANIDFTGSTNSSFGSNTTGVVFYTAYRPIVENVIMRDCGSMILQSTLGAQVRGIHIDSQTNGFSDYGIAITGSDDTVIDGMVSHRCRHAFTTSAQDLSNLHRYGTLRRPIIRNAEAWSSGYDTAEYNTTFTVSSQDVTDNVLTLTTPGGLALGSYVRLSTTGSLPGNLAASTNYFVRSINGSKVQLTATTGGSAIDITSTGSGTHTLVKSYSTSSSVLNESNLVFDTHPEGYEVTFEDCTAHLVGPSSLGGSGAGAIGFSTRSRGTIYRRCHVYGDTSQKHRGFKISSCPNTRIENCYMKGGWVGVHAERSGTPNPDSVVVLGGRFESLTNEGILLDGGIAHIIDGVAIENVGSSSSGVFGSQRACISFHDEDGVGFGFSIVRNCFLPKTTNLYSIGIGGYGAPPGPVLTSSMIQLYNNRMPDYDHGQIGINRTLAEAAGIEIKWAKRQDTYHPHTHVQQTAHGLVIGNKYAPITSTHTIYNIAAANQLVVGILMDVLDANCYVLAKQGESIEVPTVELVGGYTIAAGRDLYFNTGTGLWQPTTPGGAHGDARTMLHVDSIEDSVAYCRIGAPDQVTL